MRKILATIALGVFLFVTPIATAGSVVSHTVGDSVDVWAVCKTMEHLDALYDQAIVPGDNSRYFNMMTDVTVLCADARIVGLNVPLRARLFEYVKTVPWSGETVEIWWIIDGVGEKALTWVIKSTEGA